MRLLHNTTVLVVLLLGLQTFSAGQAAITGRVVSGATDEPLFAVNVLVQGTALGASTDGKGEFRISIMKPGTYVLLFSCVGFHQETRTNVVVEEGKTVELSIRMTLAPIQGEPIVVTASKREQSVQDVPVSVSTLDAASIARRNIVTLDDALRYVPGVNLTDWRRRAERGQRLRHPRAHQGRGAQSRARRLGRRSHHGSAAGA